MSTARAENVPASLSFTEPVQWFVYQGTDRHQWTFVNTCSAALTGHEAIAEVLDFLESMGRSTHGTFMAAPTPALYTVQVGEEPDATTEQEGQQSDS